MPQLPDKIPVRLSHSFDEMTLFGYLEVNIDGFQKPVSTRQFAGGQSNPTFVISLTNQNLVLKCN